MFTFSTRAMFAVVAIVAVACFALTRLILPAREAARGMSCGNNLKQIGLGLLYYEETFRSLPIAAETDFEGKLWRSWRSQIYPVFMEQSSMYYDIHASWDSPSNMRLLNGTPVRMDGKDGGTLMVSLDRYPRPFACPSCSSHNRNGINYVIVSGEPTAFPRSKSVQLRDIEDGLANTIIVVESKTCTPDWTEPRDLEFEAMSFVVNAKNKPSISSVHPRGPLVCFADLEVYHLTPAVTESEVKAMLTIAGRESVKRDDLVLRGVIVRP